MWIVWCIIRSFDYFCFIFFAAFGNCLNNGVNGKIVAKLLQLFVELVVLAMKFFFQIYIINI